MAIKISSALGGGLIGACALTLLHEGMRRLERKSPPTDSLGLNALSKIVGGFGDKEKRNHQDLLKLTPTGEVVSNAIYFSIAGIGSKKNVMLRSALLGLTAGLGALLLPRYLGLEEKQDSNKSKLLTISRYILGSVVTAATIRGMEKVLKKEKKSNHLSKESLLKEGHKKNGMRKLADVAL